MAQCRLPRYAGMVFNVRVKQPQSIAGRLWNRAQDVSPIVPLTFIVLKLTGVVTWAWWWVLSPVWISGILLVVALGTVLALLIRAANSGEIELMETADSADTTLR
jgi:MFS superfamily sulfate permease-like transporter